MLVMTLGGVSNLMISITSHRHAIPFRFLSSTLLCNMQDKHGRFRDRDFPEVLTAYSTVTTEDTYFEHRQLYFLSPAVHLTSPQVAHTLNGCAHFCNNG